MTEQERIAQIEKQIENLNDQVFLLNSTVEKLMDKIIEIVNVQLELMASISYSVEPPKNHDTGTALEDSDTQMSNHTNEK